MSGQEILACPFCGERPAVAQAWNDPDWWLVTCNADECRVKPEAQERGRSETLLAWNERAKEVVG